MNGNKVLSHEQFKQIAINKVLEIFRDNVPNEKILSYEYHSFSSLTNHVSLVTERGHYFVSVLDSYVSRNDLLFEVKLLVSLEDVGFPAVRVRRIGDDYVHKVQLHDWMYSLIFYEYLEGTFIPYNTINEQQIFEIFRQIADLHNVLRSFNPIVYGQHTINYRRSRYTNTVLSMNDQYVHYLLSRNFHQLDYIKIKGIADKWEEHKEKLNTVRSVLFGDNRQIIHGDLSQVNILLTNDVFTFIDFHDAEIAPKEWDLAWAIVHWSKWQEKFTLQEFYNIALAGYEHSSTQSVDRELLKNMIITSFLVMFEMGLVKTRVGEDDTQAKHLIDTSLYYLYNEAII